MIRLKLSIFKTLKDTDPEEYRTHSIVSFRRIEIGRELFNDSKRPL